MEENIKTEKTNESEPGNKRGLSIRSMLIVLFSIVLIGSGIYLLYFDIQTIIGVILMILGTQIAISQMPAIEEINAIKEFDSKKNHQTNISLNTKKGLSGNIYVKLSRENSINIDSENSDANIIFYDSIEELKILHREFKNKD